MAKGAITITEKDLIDGFNNFVGELYGIHGLHANHNIKYTFYTYKNQFKIVLN